MIAQDLLAVRLPPDGRLDVYSGVARLSGTLWATRWQPAGHRPSTAVLLVHPTSNFLGHYALRPLAERGVAAIGMTTRYLGNDSALIMENAVLDVGAVVARLRDEGYEHVVLVGNSGGGALAALYQSQAEKPTITATPLGDPPDLTAAGLVPADALVLAMAHPGRSTILTEWLDAAIVDEQRPFDRDPALDVFDTRNGPPFAPEWVSGYRDAQLARNGRITAWVRTQLAELAEQHSLGGSLDDLPFVVHGTAADPRFLDLTLDPSDRAATTLWGDPWMANFRPATLAHATSLRSWISQWSIDDSRSAAVRELPHVSVPVQVVYGTADTAALPVHARAMADAVLRDDTELVEIPHADHYFRGQPDLAAVMCDHIVRFAERTRESSGVRG